MMRGCERNAVAGGAKCRFMGGPGMDAERKKPRIPAAYWSTE